MGVIVNFNNLTEVATELRKDLTGDNRREKDLVLLFAHNGTGKTRLSMEFKEVGKNNNSQDTLYFNAFTEDLFTWDNDLESNTNRTLKLNANSIFFLGLQELEMETRIGPLFQNYVDLNFFIDYEDFTITFSRNIISKDSTETVENIKISRGEENLFIWCFFIAICEIAIDHVNSEDDSGVYSWVKYLYIDDPISSLDENNAIALACDLAGLIRRDDNNIKTIISTHHSLFFNVMFNELKVKRKTYFLHSNGSQEYRLQDTKDTPFFHHIALLSELKIVSESNIIHTYHFNGLRTVMEKVVSFFGFNRIDEVIHGLEDEVLFHRAVQLLSHGKYSIFAPSPMTSDNKELFKKILEGFLEKYEFQFPEIFNESSQSEEA